jgi:hypothetical protein
MRGRIEAIEEKILDPVTAKLVGRQADVVNDDSDTSASGGRSPKFGEGSQVAPSSQPSSCQVIIRSPAVRADSASSGR